jgi:NTP pyrophosphatase (non-canonical NTP hydrolase)
MNFEEYSKQAYSTAQYPMKGSNLVYPAIKLAGEAGETADKIGKHWRNHHATSYKAMSAESYSADERFELVKELGDVLWYINALAIELGVTLESVAQANLEKLAGRAARGTILSSGDNR